MFTAIPVDDMAETLNALAGSNAGNAARHFGKCSFDSGDVARAIYWSNIVRILECAADASAAPSGALDRPPVPRRLEIRSGATAFDGVRFEDVDADLLIREAAQETPPERKDDAAGEAHDVAEPSPLLSPQPGREEDGDPHETRCLPVAA